MSKLITLVVFSLSLSAMAADKAAPKAKEGDRKPQRVGETYSCMVASSAYEASEMAGRCPGGLTATTSNRLQMGCCPADDGGGSSGGGQGGGAQGGGR